jgi:hypothetical protein
VCLVLEVEVHSGANCGEANNAAALVEENIAALILVFENVENLIEQPHCEESEEDAVGAFSVLAG